MKLRYLPGYLWSALTVLPGLFFLLLAFIFRSVERSDWYGPALLVRMKGRVSAYMGRTRSNGRFWWAHTVGFCCFFYHDPAGDPSVLVHERRHVLQGLILGPLQPVIYALSWLWGLIATRDLFQAYWRNALERDARRAAGEEE